MKKRIFTVLLASAIAFSGMPGSAFAAEETGQEDGFFDGEIVDNVEEPVENESDIIWEEKEGFIDETDSEAQFSVGDEDIKSNFVETGKCGENATYTLTGDETNGYILTIGGFGKMSDYSWYEEKKVPWDEKKTKIIKIIIGDQISSIGDYAFNQCNITSVTIPEGVTSIGEKAFGGCTNMTNVIISKGVENIGEFAFQSCSSLTSVMVPESVIRIDGGAFESCTNLTSVILPDGITSLESGIFQNCISLTGVVIPASVKKIGYYAFETCSSLANITIPENVTDIGACAFDYCKSLTSITIPASVTNVGLGMLNGCISLKNIYYGGSKEQWDELKIEYPQNVEITFGALQTVTPTPTSTPTPMPTKVPQPITTPVPTNAPQPTAVPQPTVVPQPTAVPQPTVVPQPINTPIPTAAPTNPSTVTVAKGKTTSVKPDSSWKNVKYFTSNKKVAIVDKKGKVKAVAAGTAKITIKSGSQKAVYTIIVPGTTAIKGIKSSVSVKKGKTYTLKPKLSYTENPDQVTYKSSNKKIATVAKNGVIKGKKKGTATITVKSGKVTKKCKVKVK